MAEEKKEKWTWAGYYEKHKEEIAQKRKEKYWSNKEFREQRKAKERENYAKKKPQVQIDRRTIVNMDGDRFVTIGRVALAINRTVNSVRTLQKNKVIPAARYHDARGWSLFTTQQLRLLKAVFLRLDSGNDKIIKNLNDARRAIEAGWEQGDDVGETRKAKDKPVTGRRSRSSFRGGTNRGVKDGPPEDDK